MNRRRSSLVSARPLEDEDLLEEILLRLPPQPSSLSRASLVCKHWRQILSNTKFLKRFHKHHGKPPLLGFFAGCIGSKQFFTTVLESPDRIHAARFSMPHSHRPQEQWRFMGCRHGLAILINDYQHEVIVWDPLTGQQCRVPFPLGFHNKEGRSVWRWHAAVLCPDPEDGHVHGDCFSSPFKLVLICGEYTQTFAYLYESVSGVWANIVSTVSKDVIHLIRPNILIGDAVYWSFVGGDILVFDTEKQTLGVIKKPTDAHITDYWSFQLLRTDDDSGLGFAVMSKMRIQLWKRKSDCDGVARWLFLQIIIQLEGLFPWEMRSIDKVVRMLGYNEDSNLIVLSTYIGDFMLDIESMQFRTISKGKIGWSNKVHYPYRNFYTTGRGVGWNSVDLEV